MRADIFLLIFFSLRLCSVYAALPYSIPDLGERCLWLYFLDCTDVCIEPQVPIIWLIEEQSQLPYLNSESHRSSRALRLPLPASDHRRSRQAFSPLPRLLPTLTGGLIPHHSPHYPIRLRFNLGPLARVQLFNPCPLSLSWVLLHRDRLNSHR